MSHYHLSISDNSVVPAIYTDKNEARKDFESILQNCRDNEYELICFTRSHYTFKIGNTKIVEVKMRECNKDCVRNITFDEVELARKAKEELKNMMTEEELDKQRGLL